MTRVKPGHIWLMLSVRYTSAAGITINVTPTPTSAETLKRIQIALFLLPGCILLGTWGLGLNSAERFSWNPSQTTRNFVCRSGPEVELVVGQRNVLKEAGPSS